jgi:hypothetical protein
MVLAKIIDDNFDVEIVEADSGIEAIELIRNGAAKS